MLRERNIDPSDRKYYTECNKCFGTGCTCDTSGAECICAGCNCYKILCFECDHKLKIDMEAGKLDCKKLHKMYINSFMETCNRYKEDDLVPLEGFFEGCVNWCIRMLDKLTKWL
jgi:hypothetical protein